MARIDHAYATEADLPSPYVLGKLSPEEERAFEEHFVDCPECLDRLQNVARLRQGLVAVGKGTPAQQASHRGVVARVAHGQLLARAATVLLMAGLAGALLQIRTLHRELDSMQETNAARTRAAERRTTELAQELDAVRRQASASSSAATTTGLSNTPVIALPIVRGASRGNPSTQFTIPTQANFVVLLLEIGDDSYPNYRATLSTRDGQSLRAQDDLPLTQPGQLGVGVSTAVLKPGDYVIQAEGRAGTGEYVPLGRYEFRILPIP